MRSQIEKAIGLLRQNEAIEPYVFRPWLDSLSFRTIVDVYLPLSRAWALAEESGYQVEPFMAGLPGRPPSALEAVGVLDRGLEWILGSASEASKCYAREEASWRKAFFSDGSPSHSVLSGRQKARLEAADAFSSARSYFLPLKLLGLAPPLSWNVATPEAVEERFGAYVGAPDDLLDLSGDPPDFEVSHALVEGERRHRWLRARESGGSAETKPLWAHVIEPLGVDNPPTLVFLHGIAMETEMWVGFEDAAAMAVDQGFRVIRPEGPWHGRRRLHGHFGGEPVLGWGPMGFLSYITRHLKEAGQLIAWARGQGGGPVGLMGLSLGGLTSQRLGSASRHWPEAYRPDALMLMVVSGRSGSLEIGGRLARDLGINEKLAEAGWTQESLEPFRPLVEPQGPPPIPSSRLFMLLGRHDELMPIEQGLALADRWQVPADNLSVTEQGHFSASLGLSVRSGIYKSFLDRVKAL